jgi:esterase
LVILHGLLGSRENWHSVSLRLATSFEVYALDLRNHGDSPHANGMEYRELAADVAEFIGSVLPRAPHVLGHSMGGKTAMQLALAAPGDVRSIIAVDISPRSYAPQHRELLDALLRLDLSAFKSRKEIEDALAPGVPDLATRRFLLKNATLSPGGGFHWKNGLEQTAAGYASLLAPIDAGSAYVGPALFVRGELSDYVTEADQSEICRLFPLAQIRTVPQAGHWVQMDNPDGLLHYLLEFLFQASRETREV